jgi:hypothetical protein
MWDGKIAFALIAAVALSAVAGWVVAARFRARVLALMSAGTAPAGPAQTAPLPESRAFRRGGAASLAANRSARRRLALAWAGIALAIGLTQSWWLLRFAYAEGGFGPVKWLLVGLVYAWVGVPVLGLLRRWNWLRTAAASLAYMAAVGGLVWLRSGEEQSPIGVASWLLSTCVPVLAVLGLAASGRLRAIGPYLLPLFLLLAIASVLGTDLLAAAMADPAGASWIRLLLGFVPANVIFWSAALLPWLLAAGPAWLLARGMAGAYRSRRFSDLLYLAGGYWLIALTLEALAASHSAGARSATLLAAWLWLPLVAWLLARWAKPPADPPHLLVLRVFQRDAEMRDLFARVIDRWRYTGRTSLIAGTDLVLDTLEPDELFAYLGGRLAERYIADEPGLAAGLRQLEEPPDPDGRFRVAEFFCYDSTWQRALHALVERADVALVDLRGLAARNAGTLYELRVLADAAGVRRVVLLADRRTDREAARAAIGEESARFVWLELERLDSRAAEEVLKLLIEGTVG